MKKSLLAITFLTLATFCFSMQLRLDLTQPNGGDLTFGNFYNIKWNSNFKDMLDIFIYKGNSQIGKVAVNVPADRHLFRWKVGNLFRKPSVHGEGFKIKIVAKKKHLMDMSNNFFAIIKPIPSQLNLSRNKGVMQRKIITPGEYSKIQQMNAAKKPDLIIKRIKTYTSRDGMVDWGFTGHLFINEPLELDVTVENVFAEYGNTRNNFKVIIQFRYGYSGSIHKEKAFWVTKNMDPGEIITRRIVYGNVQSTPGILYIKVIADPTHAVNESNPNNNTDEISIRIKNKY